jgi:hypothetical protein
LSDTNRFAWFHGDACYPPLAAEVLEGIGQKVMLPSADAAGRHDDIG